MKMSEIKAHSKFKTIFIGGLFSLAILFNMQNCGRGFQVITSSSQILPPEHPVEPSQSTAFQQLQVGNKSYMSAVFMEVFGPSEKPDPIQIFRGDEFSLRTNQTLRIQDKFTFVMQSDGNLVLYDSSSRAVWAISFFQNLFMGTRNCAVPNQPDTCLAVFQKDGNLVVYNTSNPSSPAPVWASGTAGV